MVRRATGHALRIDLHTPPGLDVHLMGIDVPSMALLSAAKRIGVDFTSTAMIGRQNFGGDRVEAGLNRMFETLGISQDARKFKARNLFCEELFGLLGAKQVESFDVSLSAGHAYSRHESADSDRFPRTLFLRPRRRNHRARLQHPAGAEELPPNGSIGRAFYAGERSEQLPGPRILAVLAGDDLSNHVARKRL